MAGLGAGSGRGVTEAALGVGWAALAAVVVLACVQGARRFGGEAAWLAVLIAFGPMLVFALAVSRGRAAAPGAVGWSVPGLAVGAGAVALAAAVTAGLGRVTWGVAETATVGPAALTGALVLLQVLAEEALFRGWLQPRLQRAWGVWPGLVGAAAVFALCHLLAGPLSPTSLVTLLLGGLLFGLLAMRTGGLAAPVGAHFAYNWAEAGGLGLMPAPYGSVVDLDVVGPAWLGGSAEGLNASVVTVAVLAAFVAALVFSPSVAPAGDRSGRAP